MKAQLAASRLSQTMVVLFLLVVGGQPSNARYLPHWPFDKLVAQADLVAIIVPIENRPADDAFPGNRSAADFVATNTWFKVAATLKAHGEPLADLTVLHFAYSRAAKIANGANFIRFGVGQRHAGWLAFLKRREDGRFEPVSGHHDSALSFRELHEPPLHLVIQ